MNTRPIIAAKVPENLDAFTQASTAPRSELAELTSFMTNLAAINTIHPAAVAQDYRTEITIRRGWNDAENRYNTEKRQAVLKSVLFTDGIRRKCESVKVRPAYAGETPLLECDGYRFEMKSVDTVYVELQAYDPLAPWKDA